LSPPVAVLPVRVRRTLRADGTTSEVLAVFCTIKERSVPAGLCADCPRCHVVMIAKDAAPRFVVCESVPASPPADGVASPHATPVWAALSADVLCVEPDVPAVSLAEVVRESSLGVVPVVDRGGMLVGIVRRADVMRWQWRDGAPAVLTDALMEKVHPVAALTSVATVAARMAFEGSDAVPVVSAEGRPVVVGIVTSRDLMSWLARPAGLSHEVHVPDLDA